MATATSCHRGAPAREAARSAVFDGRVVGWCGRRRRVGRIVGDHGVGGSRGAVARRCWIRRIGRIRRSAAPAGVGWIGRVDRRVRRRICGVGRRVGGAMMGKGLGNVFGGLLRAAAPVLKKIGTTVGKRALKAGVSVASDLLGGKNIKSSLKRRAQEAGGELLGDLASVMSSPPKQAKKSPWKKVRNPPCSGVSRCAGQTERQRESA